MALQVSLSQEESGIGVQIPAAYARIVGIQWSVQDEKLFFGVEYHWDSAARKENLRPIGGQMFAAEGFDFSQDSGIKRMLYTYLKTLPAFKDAADV